MLTAPPTQAASPIYRNPAPGGCGPRGALTKPAKAPDAEMPGLGQPGNPRALTEPGLIHIVIRGNARRPALRPAALTAVACSPSGSPLIAAACSHAGGRRHLRLPPRHLAGSRTRAARGARPAAHQRAWTRLGMASVPAPTTGPVALPGVNSASPAGNPIAGRMTAQLMALAGVRPGTADARLQRQQTFRRTQPMTRQPASALLPAGQAGEVHPAGTPLCGAAAPGKSIRISM